MNVLFLYLKAFSFTGGIEKFNRSFLKALTDLTGERLITSSAISAYDSKTDDQYFSSGNFKGYSGSKIAFTLGCLVRAFRYDVFVISHINLAPVGYLIKKLKPSAKLIVMAHGIEVWHRHSGMKRKLLDKAHLILAVSNYTKSRLVELNPGIDADKIRIFPNTIDPFVKLPASFEKPQYLASRYKLSSDAVVLLTITRLSSSEKYKGYDDIIETMPEILKINSNVKYLVCGKADDIEKNRLEKLIAEKNVGHAVQLVGFIPDAELTDHYLLADIFVLKSTMEGFGIVFIEALACGRNVIGGNKDGSVDALMNGKLGKLIDPYNKKELVDAIRQTLQYPDRDPLEMQKRVTSEFGFERYKSRLRDYLMHLRTA